MAMIPLFLILTLITETPFLQVPVAPPQAVEEHIRDLERRLPVESTLRRSLAEGARGNGIHYGWMDHMRKQEIRRAVVWVDILFDQKGRPKKISLNHIEYFAEYEGTGLSDVARLDAIRASGLEKELCAVGLERAARGSWVDVPSPKHRPLAGGTKVELLDDEWLPLPSRPLYYVHANQ